MRRRRCALWRARGHGERLWRIQLGNFTACRARHRCPSDGRLGTHVVDEPRVHGPDPRSELDHTGGVRRGTANGSER